MGALTAAETRAALGDVGFKEELFQDDTQTSLEWFKSAIVAPTQGRLNLGVVMGVDFHAVTGNLARNMRENRLGVLSATMKAGEYLTAPINFVTWTRKPNNQDLHDA